ncbi:MAG TPA: metal-dependent transcriptional regulator [Tepidisphaeraceae bacterium]
MPSSTVENYLKQIYLEQQAQQGHDLVAMGRLAAAMTVTPGTATTMIKALAEANLVAYEPRSGVRLTRAGEQLALHVLRRHRLLELFLVKALGLDWSEVHDEAEHLEHAVSDKVLQRIDDYLGHPAVDPHGDPIPTSKGKLVPQNHQSLAEVDLHRPVRIARIADQEPAFLQFLHKSGLTPGVALTVQARDPQADNVQLKLTHKSPALLSLGTAAAAKILVEST